MLFNLFSCSHTWNIFLKNKQKERGEWVSEKKTSRVNELLVVYLRNRWVCRALFTKYYKVDCTEINGVWEHDWRCRWRRELCTFVKNNIGLLPELLNCVWWAERCRTTNSLWAFWHIAQAAQEKVFFYYFLSFPTSLYYWTFRSFVHCSLYRSSLNI